jgi:hypothetical protein
MLYAWTTIFPNLEHPQALTDAWDKMSMVLSPNLITVNTAIAKARMVWNMTSTTEIPHAASIYNDRHNPRNRCKETYTLSCIS